MQQSKSLAAYVMEIDRDLDRVQFVTNRPLPRGIRRALAKIYRFRDRSLQSPKSA